MSDETGDSVFFDDDEGFACGDHLLDLDVLVAGEKQEVRPVLSDALVLGEREREPLEAATR